MVIAAPNGARHGKADHPGLPVTVSEIATEAGRCHENGAAVLHLHVRTDEGAHSLDPGRYREAISHIGDVAPDMIVQITTEAAGSFGLEEQIACVKAVRPVSASVAWREFSPETNPAARHFYRWAADENIHVQHILYSPADIERFATAQRMRELAMEPQTQSVLLVLGSYAGRAAAPGDLEPFLSVLPPVRDWCVCAFGAAEHEVVSAAIAAGGHARVGMENNFLRKDGSVAAGTHELVAQIDTEKLSPAEVRRLWNLTIPDRTNG